MSAACSAILAAILAVVIAGCSPAPATWATDGGGCVRELPPCPAMPPSYKETVSPILERACISCHYPESNLARSSLTPYAAVAADLGSMVDQVYACAMPPPGHLQLTAAERTSLLEWLECKAPDN